MNLKIKIWAICISVCTIAIGLAVTKLMWKEYDNNDLKYTYSYDCIKEAELSYYKTKSLLVEEMQQYINNISPESALRAYAIVDECEYFNVDPIFVLVQGELESHFATKGIGSKLNNVFNVGVFDNLTYTEISKNYKYDYPNQSIKPYLELLINNYLINGKTEESLMIKYIDKNGNRYASDPNYESKLKSKYDNIVNNTNMKNLYLTMKSYATKCNR